MIPSKRGKLRTVIHQQFKNGINKADLVTSIEEFIDTHYPEGVITYRREILTVLANDIIAAGGLAAWKNKLLLGDAKTKGILIGKR